MRLNLQVNQICALNDDFTSSGVLCCAQSDCMHTVFFFFFRFHKSGAGHQ